MRNPTRDPLQRYGSKEEHRIGCTKTLTKPVQNSPEGTLAVHFPFGMPLRARQKPQGALTDKKSKGEKTKADLEPS